MTTLEAFQSTPLDLSFGRPVTERRKHRRHDLEMQCLPVQRWDAAMGVGRYLGTLLDISAGGIKFKTTDPTLRVDQQIRIRLNLPAYAGISPFIDTAEGNAKPRSEWVGWVAVNRVINTNDGHFEVAGALIDMEELDRGMLGLYLSTQPLAA